MISVKSISQNTMADMLLKVMPYLAFLTEGHPVFSRFKGNRQQEAGKQPLPPLLPAACFLLPYLFFVMRLTV